MSGNTHFVVWKRYLDWEGYATNACILSIKHTKKEAEEYIEALPIPAVWDTDYPQWEYIIKEI